MNVKDLDETVRFYEEIFGFEEKEKGTSMSGNPYKIIGIPNKVYLCLYESEFDDPEIEKLNHLGFNIEDFDSALEKLKKAKVKINVENYQFDHSRSIYIEDPNGIEIELSEKFGGDLN
ncbi:MAG: VOC family protein [Halobacteriovoraceae bacterium]|nr:VOC family protein [Halobacteriovoraceae bacterium]